MPLLEQIDWSSLSPAKLWKQLDVETREAAARSIYSDPQGNSKAEADALIAQAMRFRPSAIRKLPTERRVQYLLKSIPIDDGLASTMLMALHLGPRAALLEGFLDNLGIPQEGGLIDDGYDMQPPTAEALKTAIEKSREAHADDEVDLYLAALVALDSETWGAIPEALA